MREVLVSSLMLTGSDFWYSLVLVLVSYLQICKVMSAQHHCVIMDYLFFFVLDLISTCNLPNLFALVKMSAKGT